MSNTSSSSSTTTTTTTPGESATSRLFTGPPSARLLSSHRSKNPFDLHSLNTSNNPLPSPTTVSSTKSASAAFNLGAGGAFGSFGLKTPKTPSAGNGSDSLSAAGAGTGAIKTGLTASEVVAGGKKTAAAVAASTITPVHEVHPLKNTWVVWYRSPGNKFQDYEKSTHKIAHFGTVEEFWSVYTHLRRPSTLPHVSDYHLFKKGIRPVWEDKENRNGGKWNIRLKKGVANRYWEDLMLAIVGDQFGEAGEDLCGAVLSVRGNEDVLSVWTRVEGATCLKIKQTIIRKLNLPAGTRVDWKSHASSLEAVNSKTQTQGTQQQSQQQQTQ
ncbi:translation initiation factor eIF 4e-like domain-containing protein [Sphaerosporella brunnea]|uniref:Translation initiation factor eIF 4e-like domain-containing protein n=1 Tax=Sphaerosporella brunnea TaxID=1250544 RepID=A0A5J5F3W8_9PEZI|nr:translation initiation factor eIF 4e-like domain-containing protein [Sphaerosporella brunnea]